MFATYVDDGENGSVSIGRVIAVQIGQTSQAEPVLVARLFALDGTSIISVDRTRLVSFESDNEQARMLRGMIDPEVAVERLITGLHAIGADDKADMIFTVWNEEKHKD